MKKTIVNKLSFTKETVTNLNDIDMNKAKGGYVTVTQDCQPTWQISCNPLYC